MKFRCLYFRQLEAIFNKLRVRQSCSFIAEVKLTNFKSVFSRFLGIQTKIPILAQGKSDISQRFTQN